MANQQATSRPTTLDVLARLKAGDYSARELRWVLAWYAGADPATLAGLLDQLDGCEPMPVDVRALA